MMPLARARTRARLHDLALGHMRSGDLLQAKWNALRALASDPRIPVALKDQGAIFRKEDTAAARIALFA